MCANSDHYHPFMPRSSSNNFQLDTAPEPENFWAATNSFFRVIMYATDHDGLTAEISRDVQPQKVKIDAESIPNGMVIKVDGVEVETPRTFVSWANYDLPLEVHDQPPLIFSHWENTDEDKDTFMRRTFKVPTNGDTRPLLKAVFCIDDSVEHDCAELEAECCRGSCLNGTCTLP
jgi:hypothetical protein